MSTVGVYHKIRMLDTSPAIFPKKAWDWNDEVKQYKQLVTPEFEQQLEKEYQVWACKNTTPVKKRDYMQELATIDFSLSSIP